MEMKAYENKLTIPSVAKGDVINDGAFDFSLLVPMPQIAHEFFKASKGVSRHMEAYVMNLFGDHLKEDVAPYVASTREAVLRNGFSANPFKDVLHNGKPVHHAGEMSVLEFKMFKRVLIESMVRSESRPPSFISMLNLMLDMRRQCGFTSPIAWSMHHLGTLPVVETKSIKEIDGGYELVIESHGAPMTKWLGKLLELYPEQQIVMEYIDIETPSNVGLMGRNEEGVFEKPLTA